MLRFLFAVTILIGSTGDEIVAETGSQPGVGCQPGLKFGGGVAGFDPGELQGREAVLMQAPGLPLVSKPVPEGLKGVLGCPSFEFSSQAYRGAGLPGAFRPDQAKRNQQAGKTQARLQGKVVGMDEPNVFTQLGQNARGKVQ